MYNFWKTHIKPIANIIKATDFLEIGAEYGRNTEQLLAFCNEVNGKLSVIDPAPKFDEAFLRNRYKQCHFRSYKDLSVNVIPDIEDFHIGLIDGDHNWYTVFNELKLIEEKYAHRIDQFPVLFFHDISWPYGRRDLYYNPKVIPQKYLQEHQKAGLLLGESELSQSCYFNAHLFNATIEGGDKNGVLTAIEDFIDESLIDFDWLKFPTSHGLGILVCQDRKLSAPELSHYLDKIRLSPTVFQEMWEGEKLRLQKLIQDYHNRIEREKKNKRWFNFLPQLKFRNR